MPVWLGAIVKYNCAVDAADVSVAVVVSALVVKLTTGVGLAEKILSPLAATSI